MARFMLLKMLRPSGAGVSGSGLLGSASGRSLLNSSGEFSDHRLYNGDEKKETSSGPNEKKSLFFGSGGGEWSFLPILVALQTGYCNTQKEVVGGQI